MAEVFKKDIDVESRDLMNALKSVAGTEAVPVIVQEGNKLACIVTVVKENKRWLLPFLLLKEQLVEKRDVRRKMLM